MCAGVLFHLRRRRERGRVSAAYINPLLVHAGPAFIKNMCVCVCGEVCVCRDCGFFLSCSFSLKLTAFLPPPPQESVSISFSHLWKPVYVPSLTSSTSMFCFCLFFFTVTQIYLCVIREVINLTVCPVVRWLFLCLFLLSHNVHKGKKEKKTGGWGNIVIFWSALLCLPLLFVQV